MDYCIPGLFTRQHRFEARYDLSGAQTLADILGGEGNFRGNINGLLEKSRTKTYVHDICVRCGTTVLRGATP